MNKPDMTVLTQVITDWGADHIAAVLDEVMFEYAEKLIRGCDQLIPASSDADNLFYMKLLRDAVWLTEHPKAER